jgi:hypothetical protein
MTCVIIGNADHPEGTFDSDQSKWRDIARFIDSSNFVVRFNRVRNQAAEWTGRRTDRLYLRGNGLPAFEFATWPQALTGVDTPREIVCVVDNRLYERPNSDPYNAKDYTGRIAAYFGERAMKRLSESVIETSCALLEAEGSRKQPSIGLLGSVDILDDPDFQNEEIYVSGFGFGDWEGHDWKAERRIVLPEGSV